MTSVEAAHQTLPRRLKPRPPNAITTGQSALRGDKCPRPRLFLLPILIPYEALFFLFHIPRHLKHTHTHTPYIYLIHSVRHLLKTCSVSALELARGVTWSQGVHSLTEIIILQVKPYTL